MLKYTPIRRCLYLHLLWLLVIAAGCRTVGPEGPVREPSAPAGTVHVTLVHLNDVYEIMPVEGGARGGLARVATLKDRLLQQNANTFVTMGGDFFSPSAIGTARVEGERLAGRQMVAVLNVMGLDFATFGNHEFDLTEEQFLQRLDESAFVYISSNVRDAAGEPFPGVLSSLTFAARGAYGEQARIGIFGLTIDSNPRDYVSYIDFMEAAREQVEALRPDVDILIALTHLSLEQDTRLTEEFPEIDLVLGGHEHENYQVWRGPDDTPILKADANARTVYVADLFFERETGDLRVETRLVPVTEELPPHRPTADEAGRWVDLAFDAFRADGFEPSNVVAEVPVTLDGLESSVRNQSTALTELIADAMLRESDMAELSVFNGGSIRIDDRIPPGPVTQYDVIRILPFGGEVVTVSLPGEMLVRVLDQGVRNRGTGGFLHHANVSEADDGTWLVDGAPVDPDRRYVVATSDFLVSGRETGLSFLTTESPDVELLERHADVREALISELRRVFGR